jgi:hypothetical protein
LPLIPENGIGADDLPEPIWSIRVAGIIVRVVRSGSSAVCGSNAFIVVVRKCTQ